jgi:hypothetical protein
MKRPVPGTLVVFFAACASFAAFGGCAVTIVDSGTTSGVGSSSSTGATSSGGGAAPCVSVDQQSCTCKKADLRIACSPKNGKLECVCSYKKVFSGICFETDPAELCDFDNGCCANYFSGQ